eukprot:Gb_06494 [translate_table: standard]
MEEDGKECREDDTIPAFESFVTENDEGNQAEEQQCGTIASRLTDSVPSPVNKEPHFCGNETGLDWNQVEAILQPSLTTAETRVTVLMQQFVESIESQILSALKQAAMDIIEHLGKEAAMRVLVAERKAAIVEQELINAKQEALTMLLRLKHNMDAQIIEAEGACLIERRRTQHMEAKLMTAQDTLKKLKAELKRRGEVLDKVQKFAHPLDEHRLVQLNSPTEDLSMRKHGNESKPSDYFLKDLSEAESAVLLAGNDGNDSHNNLLRGMPISMFPHSIPAAMQVMPSTLASSEQMPGGKPILPSIIMKSKEQHVPGSGYDQRRFEETANESVLEGNENKECLSTEADLLPQSTEERHPKSTVSDLGQTEIPVCTAASLTHESNTQIKSQSAFISVGYPCQTQAIVDSKDRNPLPKKDTESFSHKSARVVTPRQQSFSVETMYVPMGSNAPLYNEDKLRVTDMGTNGAGNVDKQEDRPYHPEPSDLIFAHDREAGALGAESPQTTSGDEKPASSRREILGVHLETQNAEFVRHDFNRHGENGILGTDCKFSSELAINDEISALSEPPGSPTNLSLGDGGIKLETTNIRNDRGGVIEGTVQSDGKKARLSADSDITKQECEGAVAVGKSSVIDGSKSSHSQVRVIDKGQAAEINIYVSGREQEVHSKPAKYTFQRKRKREAVFEQKGNLVQEENVHKKGIETKPDECFPNPLSGKLPQKQRTSSLPSQNSNLVVESSRDSRRLMQGARQLISLSGKKRW